MPDDHYCCKTCGHRDCICPPSKPVQSAVTKSPAATMMEVALKESQEKLRAMKHFTPQSCTQDFRDHSITWKFPSQREAQKFMQAVILLMESGD